MSVPALDVMRPETASTVGTEIAATTAQLAERLNSGAITSVGDLEQFVLDRQDIGDAVKRVQEFFTPLKRMADQLHKALCHRENEILGPLLRLDRTKRDAISVYKSEQDRIRAAAEREQADQQRREREAAAAHEAAALERVGDHELAAAVLEEAVTAPAPVVALPDVTRVEGLKFVRRWLWKYAGGPADVRHTPPAVLARTMKLLPREFLIPDEKKIGAYARSMKGSGAIPGVQIYYVDDPVR
jgi:hypothetical protein